MRSTRTCWSASSRSWAWASGPGRHHPPSPGTSYDRIALTGLQRDEVKIATADLECEKREVTPVEDVVRPQHEQAFRKQNRALLERVPPAGS